jgi:hypothetical protein
MGKQVSTVDRMPISLTVLLRYFDPKADACGCASNQDKGRTHDGR